MPRIRLAMRSGWKTSKSSSFSPVEAKRIGWPVTSRTLSAATTAGVAVELGEDDTGDADSLTESVGRADRVLTDHCVEDEDGLVRVDGVTDTGGLRHQLRVDTEATGGVDDHDVVMLVACFFDAGAGDLDGVGCGKRPVRSRRRRWRCRGAARRLPRPHAHRRSEAE